MTRQAWIIDGVRSPRGRAKPNVGALSHIHPQRILAQVLEALADRLDLTTEDVDDVIAGCAAGGGDHANDIARMAVLDAGWSIGAPGLTIDRFCGSGQQAVNLAAMGILAGHQDVVVGGGVESMSRYAPMHVDGLQSNNDHLFERYPLVPQGVAADVLATIEGFTREACDEYAALSQARAAVAIAEDRFGRSIVPIRDEGGNVALARDDHPRPDTTLEGLATLRPSFVDLGGSGPPGSDVSYDQHCLDRYPDLEQIDHVHHAGSSSGWADGASAILLASPEYARAQGWTPRARLVMSATAADDPVLMLTAPAPATFQCLERAGMSLRDIDLFEVNEAFAAVVLKFLADTGLDLDRVNVNGGAIALGHPIGATGPMLIQTVLDELERRDLSTGLVAMCTGGGMGTATIIERL